MTNPIRKYTELAREARHQRDVEVNHHIDAAIARMRTDKPEKTVTMDVLTAWAILAMGFILGIDVGLWLMWSMQS